MFTSLKLCTVTPLGMCVPEKKLQQTKQNRETMQTIGKQRIKKKRLQIGYGNLSASTSFTLSFQTKCGVFPTLRKQATFHDANTGFPAK